MVAVMCVCLAVSTVDPGPMVVPKAGMVLSRSAKIAPGIYRLNFPQGEAAAGDERIPTFKPALQIKGNGIVVDFAGTLLRGSDASVMPDQRSGLAVQVEGNNITIKNLRARGYKVALIARHCSGLRIVDSDLSYNWKSHLGSTLEREDLADWQSYHHNEHDEWLRYGAGIYLSDCDKFEIHGVRILGGQCGLMLNRCRQGRIWGNHFSFLTGVGVGLYRSNENVIARNRIDWCVRGFSYGVYNRGQDSAGLLVFEQSSRNLFALNSVTHGGDGFFLWAGQSTMDTGVGGCNDNVVYGNDFSHSPANGIEATFSRNALLANKLVECWHGVWGGYSYETKVDGNVFAYNAASIAIEHGHRNDIVGNRFLHEYTGIDLWQSPITDLTWGYPKHADTESHDYRILGNRFDDVFTDAVRLRSTVGVAVQGNSFAGVGRVLRTEPGTDLATARIDFQANRVSALATEPEFASGNAVQLDATAGPARPTMQASGIPVAKWPTVEEYLARFNVDWSPTAENLDPRQVPTPDMLPLPGQGRPTLPPGILRGQRYILVDEWGPYDFRRPLLWPRQTLNGSANWRRFEVLGPPGKWRVVTQQGIRQLSATTGAVPGFVDVDIPRTSAGTVRLELEYIGAATTDFRGIVTPAGRPVRFEYRTPPASTH